MSTGRVVCLIFLKRSPSVFQSAWTNTKPYSPTIEFGNNVRLISALSLIKKHYNGGSQDRCCEHPVWLGICVKSKVMPLTIKLILIFPLVKQVTASIVIWCVSKNCVSLTVLSSNVWHG